MKKKSYDFYGAPTIWVYSYRGFIDYLAEFTDGLKDRGCSVIYI